MEVASKILCDNNKDQETSLEEGLPYSSDLTHLKNSLSRLWRDSLYLCALKAIFWNHYV